MTKFYRNIAGMMMGVGGAQVITLLASPIIARLFSPEDFGKAALFLSIVAIAVIPSTLRLEHAIVLPKQDSEALSILYAVTIVLVLYALTAAVTLFAASLFDFPWLLDNDLGSAVYLLPLGILLLGFAQILTGWATREKKFRPIAVANIWQSIVIVALRITSGVLGATSYFVLICSQLFGVLLRSSILARALRGSAGRDFSSRRSSHSMRSIVSIYRQFPLFSVPTGLLRSLNDNLPVFILALAFEPVVVGLYAMASRLIKVPVQVMGEPVRIAYLQRLSELVRSNARINQSLLQLTLILLLLSLLIILPLAFFGVELFSLVLGDNWADAGIYAAIIAPWFASIFIQVPSACVYIVFKKQQQLLVFQGCASVLLLLASSAHFYFELNITEFLSLFSLFGTLLNFVIIVNAFLIGAKYDVGSEA